MYSNKSSLWVLLCNVLLCIAKLEHLLSLPKHAESNGIRSVDLQLWNYPPTQQVVYVAMWGLDSSERYCYMFCLIYLVVFYIFRLPVISAIRICNENLMLLTILESKSRKTAFGTCGGSCFLLAFVGAALQPVHQLRSCKVHPIRQCMQNRKPFTAFRSAQVRLWYFCWDFWPLNKLNF